jgi:hypothetical protein
VIAYFSRLIVSSKLICHNAKNVQFKEELTKLIARMGDAAIGIVRASLSASKSPFDPSNIQQVRFEFKMVEIDIIISW